MSTRRNIPILPDSTGRRIILRHHLQLSYQGAASLTTFGYDDVITGQSSGVVATVNRVIASSVSQGDLIVTLGDDVTEGATFADGENILLNGSTVATVVASSNVDLYVQPNQIVSYDNPYHGQTVDRLGAAYVRFSNGSPSIDSSSRLRTQEATPLGAYDFAYDDAPNEFSNITVVSGTVTYESGSHASLLTTDTLSGSRAQRTSNLWHKYVPGQSQLIEVVCAASEDGKEGVVRRWGYFDDNDGVYFELSGTQKSVVVRRTLDGTFSETKILQSDWNADTLDGTNGADNRSDISLDASKINEYWFDCTFPGRIRFGVNIGNERRTLHTQDVENVEVSPIVVHPSLPVRWEQENVEAPASTSEFRVYSSRVWTGGKFDPSNFAKRYEVTINGQMITNTPTPIMAIRPALTGTNGEDNRAVLLLKYIGGYAVTGSTSLRADELVQYEGYFTTNAAAIGTTYSVSPANSFFQVDDDISIFGGGSRQFSGVMQGRHFEDVSQFTNYIGPGNLKLSANNEQTVVVITAKTLVSGAVANMGFTLGWEEVID